MTMDLNIRGLRVDADVKNPGSRGGHVIGRTRSGKPIYMSFKHPAHKDFTAAEHEQAAAAHDKIGNKIEKEHSVSNGKPRFNGQALTGEHAKAWQANAKEAKAHRAATDALREKREQKTSKLPAGHERLEMEGATAVSDHGKFEEDPDGSFEMASDSHKAQRDAERDVMEQIQEAGLKPSERKQLTVKHHKFIEFDSGNPYHAAAYHSVHVSGPKELIARIKKHQDIER